VPFLEAKEDSELYWQEISSVTEQALRALEDSRRKEGEASRRTSWRGWLRLED